MNTEEIQITWQGIRIAISYTPERFGRVPHLEIKSIRPQGAPLPISETGYYSWFCEPGVIDSYEGGVVAYVTAWLDEAALSKEWQKQQAQSCQLDLF